MVLNMKYVAALLLMLSLVSCSTTYPNLDPTNQMFPTVTGTTLEKEEVSMPGHFQGKQTLLLIGYVQNSQLDIDRWLIGLDMTKTKLDVYELPTIAGMAPRMFQTFIDDGMRSGIPKELWKGVITIYKDGELIQQLTGNTRPLNARVMLLDATGKIEYFYDRGFSVAALNEVRSRVILEP